MSSDIDRLQTEALITSLSEITNPSDEVLEQIAQLEASLLPPVVPLVPCPVCNIPTACPSCGNEVDENGHAVVHGKINYLPVIEADDHHHHEED